MNLNQFYIKKGWCQGPLDFPMKSSDDARELETLIKQSEAEGLGYQKVFVPATDIKAQDTEGQRHTALLTASTEDIDRDGEVVSQKGINLKLFRKNPVVAWAHDYTQPPIGRSLWEKLDGKLKALVKFADRPEDWPATVGWFPDTIFALCDQGILKGVSIGFLATEATSPTTKEIEARPELAAAKRIIRKSILCEISIVPIGCNPSALVEQVKKGLVTPDVADMFGVELPEPEEVWLWDTKDYMPEKPAVVVPDRDAVKLAMLKQLKASLR